MRTGGLQHIEKATRASTNTKKRLPDGPGGTDSCMPETPLPSSLHPAPSPAGHAAIHSSNSGSAEQRVQNCGHRSPAKGERGNGVGGDARMWASHSASQGSSGYRPWPESKHAAKSETWRRRSINGKIKFNFGIKATGAPWKSRDGLGSVCDSRIITSLMKLNTVEKCRGEEKERERMKERRKLIWQTCSFSFCRVFLLCMCACACACVQVCARVLILSVIRFI